VVATFVEIVWHDAHADTTTWIEKDEISENPCVVVSCGILLPEAKPDHIVLSQSMNSYDQLDCVLSVPVGMVQSMRVLGSGLDASEHLA
jgi:hypothetical protein